MKGFFDARCSKCDCAISWRGKFGDKPPCPKCKHQDEESPEDKKALDEMQELLRQRKLNR